MINRNSSTVSLGLVAAFAIGAGGPAAWAGPPEASFLATAPEGFIPPPLHPAGVELRTQPLGDGVYALLSGHPGVDNNGFIVGDDGVLVIDAHINGEMARQIQAAVRRVTDKPILYLVNTNYHGDHTFGNYAFPDRTRIVAHRKTAEHMRHFEHEKSLLLPTVNDDRSVYDDALLRLPDIVFDERLQIDLGGRTVELYHFGAGNTAGDTVVYEPVTRTAWTGNLVIGAGIPPVFEGRTRLYLQTISRFASTLDVETIIPGHAPPTDGRILGRYMQYLGDLLVSVRRSVAAGRTLDDTLAANPLDEGYLPPADSAMGDLRPFIEGLHRLNVQQTYRDMTER